MTKAPNETDKQYFRKIELQQLRDERDLTLEELKELRDLTNNAISHLKYTVTDRTNGRNISKMRDALKQCIEAMNAISENFPQNSAFIRALDNAYCVMEDVKGGK